MACSLRQAPRICTLSNRTTCDKTHVSKIARWYHNIHMADWRKSQCIVQAADTKCHTWRDPRKLREWNLNFNFAIAMWQLFLCWLCICMSVTPESMHSLPRNRNMPAGYLQSLDPFTPAWTWYGPLDHFLSVQPHLWQQRWHCPLWRAWSQCSLAMLHA